MIFFFIYRTICLLIPFSFFLSGSIASESLIEVYDIKRATWPNNPDNFSKVENPGDMVRMTVGMGSTDDMGYGIASVSSKVPSNLIFDATTTGELRIIDLNTYVGLIIDYHTPSGFIKRTGIPIGVHSETREDYIPGWGKGNIPDSIINPINRVSNHFEVDLAGNAPIGWDGLIWLSAIIENTGKNTTLEILIQNVALKQNDNPFVSSDTRFDPFINWKEIPLTGRSLYYGNLGEQATIALHQFGKHLPIQIAQRPINSIGQSNKIEPRLIIGKFEEIKGIFGEKAEQWYQRLYDLKEWRQEQGYLIQYYENEDLLVAISMGNLGLVYAISHLQRCIIDSPQPALALEDNTMVEKPATQERGVYINIGYGLSSGPITPDNWEMTEWEQFIDDLVLSRATFWSFFLWTEIEHIYPDTERLDLVEKNKHVFKMLRHAIRYSQKRGLRSVFLFTPTNIPAEIIGRHPDWACQLEYTNSGGICSRHPDAYEMAKVIHRFQMNYFREANEFDIAFYDPGGCMCSECQKGDVQLEQLLKQVDDFSKAAWSLNPEARFGFWTWAVWRYERIHQYSLQNHLLPEIAKRLTGNVNRVTVIDSFHGDIGSTPYFEEAKQHGFRTSNFVYQTNIEDGNVFLLPLIEFQKKWAAMTQEKQLDEAFLMIMEVKSKYPMAHFGCEFFWDALLSREMVVERFALQLCGNIEAARQLRNGFLAMEKITFDGVNGSDNPSQLAAGMKESIENALKLSPRSRLKEIEWLFTTAQVFEILVKASIPRMERNTAELDKLNKEFISILSGDPLFNHFAECCGNLFFDRLVGWVSNGFKQGYF